MMTRNLRATFRGDGRESSISIYLKEFLEFASII